jgi:hypothetical protein
MSYFSEFFWDEMCKAHEQKYCRYVAKNTFTQSSPKIKLTYFDLGKTLITDRVCGGQTKEIIRVAGLRALCSNKLQ